LGPAAEGAARALRQEGDEAERGRRQGRAREDAAEGAGEDAPRARGGAREVEEGARDARGLPAQRPARVPRVDRRREDRRDARAPRRAGGRVARRGQAAQLEVRGVLSAKKQNTAEERRARRTAEPEGGGGRPLRSFSAAFRALRSSAVGFPSARVRTA